MREFIEIFLSVLRTRRAASNPSVPGIFISRKSTSNDFFAKSERSFSASEYARIVKSACLFSNSFVTQRAVQTEQDTVYGLSFVRRDFFQ